MSASVKDGTIESPARESRWKKMVRSPHFIYALLDPRDMRVRYIGCCMDVVQRYEAHLRKTTNSGMRAWIAELKSLDLRPRCVTLTTADGFFEGRDAERLYIYEYDELTDGGLLNEVNVLKSMQEYRVERLGAEWLMAVRKRALNEIKHTLPKRQRVPRDLSTYRTGPMPWYGVLIEFNGRRQNMSAWARELGISREALRLRLLKYPVDIALSIGKQAGGANRIDGTCPVECQSKPRGPKSPRKATLKGLTHAERRHRRQVMAGFVASGRSLAETARKFDVVEDVVRKAVKEFAAGQLVAPAS